MAKADINIGIQGTIEDILVSKKAEDRIVKLRRELRELKAGVKELDEKYDTAHGFKSKEKILLSKREALNREISIARRLGYDPKEMGSMLATRSALNSQIAAVHRGTATEERQQVKEEIKNQRKRELFEWAMEAASIITDPKTDMSRPIMQLGKKRVRSILGSTLVDPSVDDFVSDDEQRKAAKIYDALSENTEATWNLTGVVKSSLAAGAGGIAFGSKVSSMVASIYGNRVDPMGEIRDDINKGFKYAGGVAGAVIGGAIAGPIGAAVGGALGAWIGGTGERSKSASDSSKQDSLEFLRMLHLYGAQAGSYYMMKLAATEGYINEADYTNMASAINSAPYMAAFGKISSDQWIGLSMMPNYFAALFGGATPEEAMQAYERDMVGRPLGLGQFATSLLGGLGPNENIRAFVNSRQFDRWLGARDEMGKYDEELLGYLNGYEAAIATQAMDSRRIRAKTVERGTQTMSPLNYGDYVVRPVTPEEDPYWASKGAYTFEPDTRYTKRELVINIDNKRVDVGTVYTQEGDWINHATSYSVGGNQ